ncbi:MAG: RagB/SusD family nutrient uptake outer membrane protein [Dysgonomonas sp.]
MKLIDKKILLIALALVLGMASCDDYLEKTPKSNLDENLVFSVFTNAEQYQATIYENVWGRFNAVGNYQPVPLSSASDESDSPRGYHGTIYFNTGAYDGIDANIYNYYEGIRRANMFLSKESVIPFPSEAKKKQLLGETYFLRAFFYHELTKRFGGMPILDETKLFKPGDNLELPRNSYKECVTFMLSDLQKAIEYMPATLPETSYGRATKGAAMALKARVLLFAASPQWQREMGQDLWSQAAAAAKDVIDLTDNGSKVYELYDTGKGATDYEQLFFTRYEDGNKEIIFAKHAKPVGFSSDEIKVWSPSGGKLGGDGAVCPTQNFVDLFETTEGYPISDSRSKYDPQKPYENRDPRFYKTVLYHGASWQGETLDVTYDEANKVFGTHRANSTDYTRTGYYVRKYLPESVKNLTSNTSYHEWIFFRLAEMYLNYAEALNETLATPSTEVYEAVNAIRRRSGMVDLPANLNKDQMRERIWNERAIELSFEEHRWWDARRWGKAADWFGGPMYGMEIHNTGVKYNEKVFYTRTYFPYMDLYPIPISEMRKNPLYDQNPGW